MIFSFIHSKLKKRGFEFLNSAITHYKCPINTHKGSQQVISTPYDFR